MQERRWTTNGEFRTFPLMSVYQASVIFEHARVAKSILEYGGGGSTLWLLQTCLQARITTIETDDEWRQKIDRSRAKLSEIPIKLARNQIGEELDTLHDWGRYDLIIVDGEHELRPGYVADSIPRLTERGVLFLHDAQEPLYRNAMFDAITRCRLIHYSQFVNERDYPSDLLGVQAAQ